MKIATYNVNGINGRLPVLLRWLAESEPDIVVLQELKAPQEKFPRSAIRDLGYDAIWHGQKSWNGVAILSRVGEIHETRRGLPGGRDDTHSRYIEAAVNGILIGGLYLPNGNPRPGTKFDYKMRWFERLIAHADGLLASGLPVMLAGDFNVMPTERDVYKTERWLDDALFAPEVRDAFFRLTGQGWTDALRVLHPDETIYNILGLFSECLWPQRRAQARSSAAEQATRGPSGRRPGGYPCPGLGKEQRSCAGVDRALRQAQSQAPSVQGGEPVGVDSGPGHMAIEIGRAIGPPDWPSLS